MVGVKKQWYTTWIGEVGLWHWGGLVLGGDGEEGFGVVSGCDTEKIYIFNIFRGCVY